MTPEQRLDRIEIQIEKQNQGIQGLIIVSRTVLTSIHEQRVVNQSVLTSIQELRETQREDHKAWREAQAATDEKLNILIDTVDRIIRHKNEPPTAS